jgi:hypothetical protein
MLKVVPITLNHEGQKVPLIMGWKEKCSSDPEQIKQWQEFFRDRLKFFGAPCGAVNNIVVLDIDVKNDQNGFDTLKLLNLDLPKTWWQATPSGGMHFFYKYDANRETGNKVKFLPGLDLRSTGGWCGLYNLNTDEPLADMPDWIWEHCQKKQREQSPTSHIATVSPEIGMEIFNSALDAIRNAPAGESNNTLNVQSYLVGQLIASGGVSREYAEQELFRAGRDRGKPEYECKATITSGIDGGLKNPRTLDLPKQGPQLMIKIPALIPDAPTLPDRWTPHFMTRSDLLNRSKLKKPQLFENWSTEDIHLTSADGGTGKTTLKLYEAICLALGEPFLGFRCYSPGRTLFITGEDTAVKLSAMIGAILNQMGFLDGSPENEAKIDVVLSSIIIKKDADLCLIAKDRFNFLTVNRDALNKVMQAVDDLQPRMIVWDPIASFWGSESSVNDMNKAVAKFMGELQERSNACVEMINHIGKQSSTSKDLSQFAGRGGTGLPSHSRVVRVLQAMNTEEYRDKTGLELEEGKSAMLCNVGKFTDGSPLYMKPFIIVRDGFLFSRQAVLAEKEREAQDFNSDAERVLITIKNTIRSGRYATQSGIVAALRSSDDSMSSTRVRDGIELLKMTGLYGEMVRDIDHPDASVGGKILTVIGLDGELKA